MSEASPRSTRRRWRFRRWSAALIAVEAIMLAVAVTAGGIGLNQLTVARARVVDEVDPQLVQAQNLTAALLNQETGLRGYLLTGQSDFRTPYDGGKQEETQSVDELHRLGAVEGTRTGDLLAIVLARAQAWQSTADEAIRSSIPAPTELVERGKSRFDALRAALEDLRVNLETTRATGRHSLYASATLLNVVLGAIAVLLAVLLALLTFGVHRAVIRPVLGLAGEVRAVTDDIHREIPDVGGPKELAELAGDVETMRRRIVAEVSELHRAHELLDTRTRALERSNSDLEQFAYVASHDLQEPLRKVASFCQLLQRRYQSQLDERGEQYIEFAVDGAKRMQVLINDLLAFSRVGRRAAEWVEVDTGELLAAATGNLERVLEETGGRVAHGELPVVRGEASLLTAVFQNLVGNALKFHGERPPVVDLRAERDGDDWVFSVTDNGIGIEAEYAERIFSIFQRLHAKSEYPGTGIGLAMTRKIIEYHGGRIWLDTTNTDGHARFCFTLPSVTTSEAAMAEPEESEDR